MLTNSPYTIVKHLYTDTKTNNKPFEDNIWLTGRVIGNYSAEHRNKQLRS